MLHILWSIGELRSLCKEYHQRICIIEDKKYDLEREVETKDWNVSLATDMYTHSLKWETFILNMNHVSFSNRLFLLQINDLDTQVHDFKGKL